MGGVWSMDTIGPISRTVEDAAITLNAIAGHDPKDPTTWSATVPDYTQALNNDISRLRIGLDHRADSRYQCVRPRSAGGGG